MALVVPSRYVPECLAQIAEAIAADDSMGYSQPNRNGDGTLKTLTLRPASGVTYRVKVHGGDYDCSSMVTQACVALGILKSGTWMYTGNQDEILRANGFRRMAYSAGSVRRGDILWVKGHTGFAVGSGRQADAHGDERGGITGPRKGDQTGSEIEVRSLRSWTYIYRWADESAVVSSGATPGTILTDFKVTAGTERNVRSTPSTASKATVTGTLKPGESVTCHGLTYADGLAWGVYTNYSGKTRYIALQGQVTVS